MRLNLGQKLFLDRSNLRLIPLVKRPLLDALPSNESRLLQDFKMLAGRRLGYSQLARDQQPANAILDQVAVDLRRKMPARTAQPVQYVKPALIGQRPQRQLKSHIDT